MSINTSHFLKIFIKVALGNFKSESVGLKMRKRGQPFLLEWLAEESPRVCNDHGFTPSASIGKVAIPPSRSVRMRSTRLTVPGVVGSNLIVIT